MRPARLLLLPVLVVVLAGPAACGSAGRAPASPATPTIAGGCSVRSAAVRHARALVRADLDGDGRPDLLSLTAGTGPCRNTRVARIGHHDASLALGRTRLATGSVTLVEVPGRRGLLVVAREPRRHGFQPHLFAYAAGRLGELRDRNGSPVVPFVGAGAAATPVTAGCARRGIVVEQAVLHRPRGVVVTWDVRRTTYAVSGTRVVGRQATRVADNVLPPRLRQRRPDLVHHVLFRNCAAAAPLSSGTVAP